MLMTVSHLGRETTVSREDRQRRAVEARLTLDGLRHVGLLVKDGLVEPRGAAIPMVGATAEVSVGAPQSRTTATRVALGTVIAPGLGTLVGAMAKKSSDQLFVTVTGADGRQVVSKALSAKDQDKIRDWVARFNSFAAQG